MKEDTQKLLDKLIKNTYSMDLATIDDNGYPFIRAVFNLRCQKHFPHPSKIIRNYDEKPYNVYISTNTSSIKMKQIRENNKVALYFSIPEPGNVKGIMLQGEAEILEDMDFKKDIWEDSWKIYYKKGYKDPDFTILRVKPNLIRGWHKGPHTHVFGK